MGAGMPDEVKQGLVLFGTVLGSLALVAATVTVCEHAGRARSPLDRLRDCCRRRRRRRRHRLLPPPELTSRAQLPARPPPTARLAAAVPPGPQEAAAGAGGAGAQVGACSQQAGAGAGRARVSSSCRPCMASPRCFLSRCTAGRLHKSPVTSSPTRLQEAGQAHAGGDAARNRGAQGARACLPACLPARPPALALCHPPGRPPACSRGRLEGRHTCRAPARLPAPTLQLYGTSSPLAVPTATRRRSTSGSAWRTSAAAAAARSPGCQPATEACVRADDCWRGCFVFG